MATEITVQQYIRELRKMTGRQRTHRLTLVNAMDYAAYLNDRSGYYVFNPDHLGQTTYKVFKRAIRDDVPMIDQKNRKNALRASAWSEINFLKSLISKLQPPRNSKEGPRQAHPGGWADDRGHLNRAYWFEIDGKATGKSRAERENDKAKRGR